MTGLSIAIIFIAHIVGCLWYYAGSVDQLMDDGQVRKGWTRYVVQDCILGLLPLSMHLRYSLFASWAA